MSLARLHFYIVLYLFEDSSFALWKRIKSKALVLDYRKGKGMKNNFDFQSSYVAANNVMQRICLTLNPQARNSMAQYTLRTLCHAMFCANETLGTLYEEYFRDYQFYIPTLCGCPVAVFLSCTYQTFKTDFMYIGKSLISHTKKETGFL